jgi:hypothetical protein
VQEADMAAKTAMWAEREKTLAAGRVEGEGGYHR